VYSNDFASMHDILAIQQQSGLINQTSGDFCYASFFSKFCRRNCKVIQWRDGFGVGGESAISLAILAVVADNCSSTRRLRHRMFWLFRFNFIEFSLKLVSVFNMYGK